MAGFEYTRATNPALVRHTWAGGNIISSSLLNNIEARIEQNKENLDEIAEHINGFVNETNANDVSDTSTLNTPTSISINNSTGKLDVVYSKIQTTTTSREGIVQLSSEASDSTENRAATPKGVQAAINLLDVADDEDRSGSYVQKVTETDGKISVTHNNLSPSLTLTDGTSSVAPKIKVTVGGNASSDIILTKASTSVYGATKLQTTLDNSEAVAATPKCVQDTITALINGTLGENYALTTDTTSNDSHLASTAFVKAAFKANDAMIFKGALAGAASTTYTPAADRGDTYRISTTGLINGIAVEVGDMLICTTDSTAAATSSNVDTIKNNWIYIQTNIDGAVTGPASSTADHIATFNGTSGKVIKDSGFTIATSVPASAVFTDTTYTAGTGLSLTGTEFSNSGVLSVVADSVDGQIKVNGTSLAIPGFISSTQVTQLFATLVDSFGLELQMPTAVAWSAETELVATVNKYADSTTVYIEKYNNGSWELYDGSARAEGDRFRANCTRTMFGATKSAVIGNEYVEPAAAE